MFGLISAKVYVVVAIITAGLLYAIDYFDKGEAAVGWLNSQMAQASGTGIGRALSGLVAKPLIYAIDGPIGAVLGGLLWPLLIVWLLLLIVLLAFTLLSGGVGQAGCAASASC